MAISLEVITFFLLLFASTRKYKRNMYFRFLPYLILFIFMAVRFDYGDGKEYRSLFYYLHNNIKADVAEGVEPLYAWLNEALPNFQCVIVVTSFVYVVAVYLIMSKSLSYQQRGMGLLIMAIHPYILMVDMSAIRQSVAIALIIIGVYIANRYKRVYYVPFCILAVFFHKSAIAMLPIVFLFNKKHFSIFTKCVVFGGMVFFILMPDKLFDLVETIMLTIGLDSANYLMYLYNGNVNGSLAVILSVLIMIFFLLCGDAIDKKYAIYVKMSILAMFFEALQGRIQQFGRIDMYFLPFLTLSIPMILKRDTQNVEIRAFGNVFLLNQTGCWFVEICFIAVFAWKFIGFMTPQFAYYSIFTAG
ncbi:MAG: EpsG family protein [Clostridia bacterium]|nr:EpsG family protein [Clostridia bacterium]